MISLFSRSRTLSIIAAVAVFTAPGISTQAHAAAHNPDRIYATGTNLNGAWLVSNSCNIAYIEPNKLWTAAHCANNGATVTDSAGTPLGIMRHLRDTKGKYTGYNDIAYVETFDDYSHRTNNLTVSEPVAIPQLGDTVCVDVSRLNESVCGTVTYSVDGPAHYLANSRLDVSNGQALRQGDSGAAVRTKNNELVGVLSGIDPNTGDFSVAVFPPNSVAEHNVVAAVPTPKPKPSRGGSSSSIF